MKRLAMLFAALLLAVPVSAAEIGDDGLHKAAWFRDTFKDLQEDAEEAAAEGKRIAIIIEQRGCIYCRKMHEDVFPHPEIEAMLEDVYFPIQLNLHGDTEVIDTDGDVLTEKSAARKWGMLFTPTIIFLPPEIDTEKTVTEQAVAIMPGAFGKGTTLDMFTWVAEERYLDQSEEDFQRYHARMIRERSDGSTD